MKKVLALIMSVIIILGLVGCGKSQEAKAVDELILNIGAVTLDRYEAIATARASFDELTAEQKSEVENILLLIDAENTVRQLIEEHIENIKTESKMELLDKNPNKAISLLEEILPLDPSAQEDIDSIYSHCLDLNDVLFIKPSLLYTGTELVGISLHDEEQALDCYYFAPISADNFYDYAKYANKNFTLNPDQTLESSTYIRYEYLDNTTGEVVLQLNLFSNNGVLTIAVKTIPQERIHTS